MAIEFEVTDINSVDEELRDAYVESEGKFVFDPDKYHELKAAPLISKNKELLSEKKKLAESVKALDAVKRGAETDIEKVASEKDQRIAALEKQLRESSIWSPVKDLAVKHGVMPDRLDAVMTLLRAQDRFDQDEEGKLIFKDKDGYPTTTKPTRAFEYYLKEELPWAFEASKAAGSGAKAGAKANGTGRVVSRESFDAMSNLEQDRVIREGARIVD
jgi:hypothetical protein